MIKSMTAFGRAEVKKKDLNVVTEIRSYNNRYLDFSLKLPYGYSGIEDKIKNEVKRKVARGRVEVKIYIKKDEDDSKTIEVNRSMASTLKETLKELDNDFGIKPDLTLDSLFGCAGVLDSVTSEKDLDQEWLVISESLNLALSELDKMRKVEGDFTKKDFEQRLMYIEGKVEEIKDGMGGILDIYKDKLLERVAKLTNGEVELDPSRIAQEAAILADKSDVSEEITRANSHIKQFRKIIEGDEPSGQKLNFLVQEFNREFNTIGSKVGNASISHIVVDLKSELEKIREQVQNIE